MPSLQALAQKLALQAEGKRSAKEECRLLQTLDLAHLEQNAHAQVFMPDEGTALLMRALTDDEAVLHELRPTICIDIGCGAGAEAIHLTRCLPPNSAAIMASDINFEALIATRATAAANKCSEPHLLCSSLLSGLRPGTVDLVLWHCPYVPTSAKQMNDAVERGDLSCSYAGGPNGTAMLAETLPMLKEVLSPKGLMYLVVCRGANKRAKVADGSCLSLWVNDDFLHCGIVADESATAETATSHLCILRCRVADEVEMAAMKATPKAPSPSAGNDALDVTDVAPASPALEHEEEVD